MAFNPKLPYNDLPPLPPRVDIEILVDAMHRDPVAADRVEIRAQQKMHVLPGAAKFRAVITSQRSATDNGDLHLDESKSISSSPFPKPGTELSPHR